MTGFVSPTKIEEGARSIASKSSRQLIGSKDITSGTAMVSHLAEFMVVGQIPRFFSEAILVNQWVAPETLQLRMKTSPGYVREGILR